MTWWNPYNREGENPFEQFDSWEDFLNHYVTPENEIVRRAGPGDVIQEGEWYITKNIMSESGDGVTNLFHLSYVIPLSPTLRTSPFPSSEVDIMYVNFHSPFNMRPGQIRISENPNNWNWHEGWRDGWGHKSYHYAVYFDDVLEYNFINWREAPWEVKG